jgi:hypothetical protein
VDFIQSNKDDVVEGRKLGVELICRVLQVAPSTYYAARDRALSARALSDTVLPGEPYSLWEKTEKCMGFANFGRRQNGQGLISGVTRQSPVDAISRH